MQNLMNTINSSIASQAQTTTTVASTSRPQQEKTPALADAYASQTQDSVSLSGQGKTLQQLDGLYRQVDDVYQSYMSKNDLQKTEDIYKKLDQLGQSADDATFEKQAEPLFKALDDIFSSAESRFSKEDAEKVNKLDQQINGLEDQLDESIEGQFGEIDLLQQQQDELLVSQLSAKDKRQVESLNKQLEQLFSNNFPSEEDQKTIESLFESLDKTLNKGFEKLGQGEQDKVLQLGEQINSLEEQLIAFEDGE